MKKKILFLCAVLLVIGVAGTAGATPVTVKAGSRTLEHAKAYIWGMASSSWANLVDPITSASITLKGIYDDNSSGYNDDQIAIFLLDDAYMNSSTATWRNITDNSVITINHNSLAYNSLAYSDHTSNLFDGITPLITYYVTEDIQRSSPGVTLTYNFTGANLTALQGYLDSPLPTSNTNKYRDIALGFDPDCAFKMSDIEFTISDTPITTPEPATMLLLGLGLIGVAGIRRF